MGRPRPSSCHNPQPTVASHENQEAQCHQQLGATTRAYPLQRDPPQRRKMVMPASARSNWKVHLGATFWRTLEGKNPNGWFPEQKLTVQETVEAYTMGSAYAEFQEKQKGSITPGKLADMVLLSDDIFSIDPAKIRDVTVLKTFVGGKLVWDASHPTGGEPSNR